MRAQLTRYAQTILDEYDPDHDVPDDVQVTWTDWHLLQMIRNLDYVVTTLETEMEKLALKVLRPETKVTCPRCWHTFGREPTNTHTQGCPNCGSPVADRPN